MPDFILHHYPQSPVAQKIRFALGLAEASWHSVEISRLPPRPLLSPMTANYRRVPVLQIGADIHCDSQNIIRAIAEAGHSESLFPDGCAGHAMALASWTEQVLFDLAVRIVITSAIGTAPPEFIADRGSLYFEPDWTEAGLQQALPSTILQLQAHLAWCDDMLLARGYAIGPAPSYADAAIAYIVWFLRGRWDDGAALLAPFEHLCRLESEFNERGEGKAINMTGETALSIAREHTPKSPIGISAGFAGGLSQGQNVLVRPSKVTADPDVVGRLRYLDNTRVSLDHESPETGAVAVHFPVAGYRVIAL